MMLINEKDKILHYYYDVKDFYFTIKKVKTKMHDYQLKSIMIVNDYAGNLFPIIQIKMALDTKTYYEIIKNKENVKVRIRIQKYTREPGKADRSINDHYIDDTFTLILDDADEDLFEEVRNINHDGKLKEDELFENANTVEFFLFKSSLLKATKKRINKILSNASVTDAIGLIATKLGINNLLMTPANNKREYRPLIIPPLRAVDAIRYIDTFYGIHNTGSMIYFGIENSYILKYDGSVSAYRPREIQNVRIVIPKAGSLASQNLCSIRKYGETDCYYLIGDHETIRFENRSNTKGLLKGNQVQVIRIPQGGEEGAGANSNKKIIVNRGFNEYLAQVYLTQINSLNTVLTIEFNDINLDAIQPNKRYTILFEDTKLHKKYHGRYILTKSEIGLLRTDADLTTTVRCTFNKIT